MFEILLTMLWYILLADLFAVLVLVLVLINARINLYRQIESIRSYYRVFEVTRSAKTSYEAAELLGMDVDDYVSFCRMRRIETPEERVEKAERIERDREAQEQRILNEEAAWRAEQEHILEERRKSQEEEARKRKERLKKFGFR